MTTRVRLGIFLLGGAGLMALLVAALLRMPDFGGRAHLYRDAAVAAGLLRHTPNVVSAVNFDQRGLDTFGEEAILLASVLGATTLLRAERDDPDDAQRPARRHGHMLQATRFVGYLLLPVTLLIGLDVVVHGHLTPGGGFQGGVVLATGLHLLYVAGSYPALRRLRPVHWYELGETAGMGAVVGLGAAGVATGAGFLANVLPLGVFDTLASAGTVPVFSIGVGIAVGSGIVVLLAQFLDQYISIRRRESAS